MYNFIEIQFPGSGLPVLFSYRTVFSQARYEHEQLVMYIKNWGLEYSSIQNGTPIHVTMRSPNGTQEFNGYVHSVKPDISPAKHFVEVTALGASYVMKQASQNIWENVTADQVVTEIAKKYGFAYHAMPHPRVYSHLIQAGETDWAFLVKLAKQSGYTLRAHNTAIYFDEMTNDFKNNFEGASYAVMRDANNPLGTSMYSFTPEIGETINMDNAVKAATSVGGVNLESNSAIVTTNQNRPTTSRLTAKTEFFDRFSPHVVVPNTNVANAEAIAADERARYPYRGHAKVIGNATLRPDLPIYLDGLGKEYSGYWTILSTEHVFEEYMYTVELEVGSDSLGTLNSSFTGSPVTAPVAVPKRKVIPNVQQSNKLPTAVLTDNTKAVNNSNKATGFATTKNRSQPKIANTSLTSSPKWSSTSGNLRTVQTKNNLSSAAVNKLRSAGVR